jgi:hypothetical protein
MGIQLQPLTMYQESVAVRELCSTCPSSAGCVAAALGDTATTSNQRAGTGDVRYVSLVSGASGGGSWGSSYNL